MHTFRDNAGREWVVTVHVTAAKRVKALLGVNLYTLVDDGFAGFNRLISDPGDLVDVVYVLCKDEADARGLSDEDFGRAMGGDSLAAARKAFTEAYIDFFDDPRRRAGLAKVFDASRKIIDVTMERALRGLDGRIEEALASASSDTSGPAPGSSASTPGPSPSPS